MDMGPTRYKLELFMLCYNIGLFTTYDLVDIISPDVMKKIRFIERLKGNVAAVLGFANLLIQLITLDYYEYYKGRS